MFGFGLFYGIYAEATGQRKNRVEPNCFRNNEPTGVVTNNCSRNIAFNSRNGIESNVAISCNEYKYICIIYVCNVTILKTTLHPSNYVARVYIIY